MKTQGPILGIDLGTTNSLVAIVKDGAPFVIRDRSGDALVPSVVHASADGTIFVGREAQRTCTSCCTREGRRSCDPEECGTACPRESSHTTAEEAGAPGEEDAALSLRAAPS